jgi:Nucleotidyltransferase domain
MADPEEGVAPDGTIRTGAHRDRIPVAFEPVLTDAVAFAGDRGASLYVYGSVANGTVRPRSSDVDLLSIDLPEAAVLFCAHHAHTAAYPEERPVRFRPRAPGESASWAGLPDPDKLAV